MDQGLTWSNEGISLVSLHLNPHIMVMTFGSLSKGQDPRYKRLELAFSVIWSPSLHEKMWSSLLFRMERSLVGMSPRCPPLEVFQAHLIQQKPRGRPRTSWGVYIYSTGIYPLWSGNTLKSSRRSWRRVSLVQWMSGFPSWTFATYA